MKFRRQFLIKAPLGLLAVATASPADQVLAPVAMPGAPPTFGAAPAMGPHVSAQTFVEAEKLMQVTLTPAERNMAAASWRASMPALLERRTGPNKLALEADLAPAMRWIPLADGAKARVRHDRFLRSKARLVPLPAHDADIAFAPVTQLSRWK